MAVPKINVSSVISDAVENEVKKEQVQQQVEKTNDSVEENSTIDSSGKYSDKFLFNFPKTEKDDFKKFAILHNVTLTDMIRLSLDFVRSEIEEGNLSISRYGIKKIK